MKKIFVLLTTFIFLLVACKESPNVNTVVVESDSARKAKEQLEYQRGADSLRQIHDSLDILVAKTGETIDSLTRISGHRKSKKLDSLINVEMENYKHYLEKREELFIMN